MKILKFKDKLRTHLEEVYKEYFEGKINSEIKKKGLEDLYFNIEFKLENKHKYKKELFEEFTTEKKSMLKLRREINNNSPDFIRQFSKNYKRVSKSWRKPVGSQNKLRKGLKEKGALVKVGFGKPLLVRNCDPKGYDTFLIKNRVDLNQYLSFENSLEAKQTSMPICSSLLGIRKRIEFENVLFKSNYLIGNPVKIISQIKEIKE